ncbi:MAG TPA: hypothetical protein VF146_02190 [Bryobacteraceae bacterium]
MKTAVRIILGFVVFVSFACAHKPPEARPESVPTEAVYVHGGKPGGWWQLCRLANAGDTVYCRIWSGAGLILYDDQFLPADGGPAPTLEELQIAPDPGSPASDRVVLTNRRILLPKSRSRS